MPWDPQHEERQSASPLKDSGHPTCEMQDRLYGGLSSHGVGAEDSVVDHRRAIAYEPRRESADLEGLMKQTERRTSVVVGIDGSSSAAHAAEWAVDEAVGRDVPLHLVYVIQSTAPDIRRETDTAEIALRAAEAIIKETCQPVKIETAVMRGPVAATLVDASADAAMICVGSTGVGSRAMKFVGATAAAVARSARCPVAIIRRRDGTTWSTPDHIAVVIDDPRDLDVVVGAALEEARLRNATLSALNVTSSRISELAPEEVDRRLSEWLGRYPDVSSRVRMVPDDIPAFLAEHDSPVQLIVTADGAAATRIVGQYGRFMLRDTGCSVLLVRLHG
jgi:nucleotide-binding universal stress UspA family protein